MLAKFKTYKLAIQLHRECEALNLKGALKDQLYRASTSIALNLAEGSGKGSAKDRKRFYQIAMGSLREIEAILELTDRTTPTSDLVASHLFNLIKNPGPDF